MQLKVWSNMVAVFSRKPLEYRRVSPRVSMAPKFLRVNNLDGTVQFIRRQRLFEPAALG
jgi:hypothetical protein